MSGSWLQFDSISKIIHYELDIYVKAGREVVVKLRNADAARWRVGGAGSGLAVWKKRLHNWVGFLLDFDEFENVHNAV